jgi:hypothetical protein
MDNQKTAEFVNGIWDESIIPELCEYIKVPNKSPMFDPDWEQHGHMDKAVLMLEAWARQQPIEGMQVEIAPERGGPALSALPTDPAPSGTDGRRARIAGNELGARS